LHDILEDILRSINFITEYYIVFRMYGEHSYPLHIDEAGVLIDVIEKDGAFFYKRKSATGTTFECYLSDGNGKIRICPVEPVNLPKYITDYLEIDFEKVMVAPNSEHTIYLKFPLEIGVFYDSGNHIALLGIFSNIPQKYTLYGDPSTGIIARYHRSDVYHTIPDVDKTREGIVKLTIINSEPDIAVVSKVVLDCYAMKIYYNDTTAAMTAEMKIQPKRTATTECVDVPMIEGMTRSTEIYAAFTSIPVIHKSFFMESGYND
jgi:hypothetical protein